MVICALPKWLLQTESNLSLTFGVHISMAYFHFLATLVAHLGWNGKWVGRWTSRLASFIINEWQDFGKNTINSEKYSGKSGKILKLRKTWKNTLENSEKTLVKPKKGPCFKIWLENSEKYSTFGKILQTNPEKYSNKMHKKYSGKFRKILLEAKSLFLTMLLCKGFCNLCRHGSLIS